MSKAQKTSSATPAVSVIMAAYNAEAHLRTAVESILNQSFTDLELIVVNDGSSDATADILSHYAQRDLRVNVVNQDNAGIAMARNVGIARSRAELVAIMDSDDIAHPRRLEMQRDFLLENPECAAVCCRCELIDERGNPIKKQRPRERLQAPGLPLEELLRAQTRVNQTAMLRIAAVGRGASIARGFGCWRILIFHCASSSTTRPRISTTRRFTNIANIQHKP